MTPKAKLVSHYEILSRIGAGAMGEVFLARDLKLGRKVAIKFLKSNFASDAERLERFVREARSASALNHPNIITVYEIGEMDGTHFIAVEFVDGQTLRECMAAGPMSFEDVLSIAIQTAEALTAAHQGGIVHRDIKPENIMIRRDGYVKVLDFGLAKLARKTADIDEEAKTLAMTSPGMLIGTALYMSPEQARGEVVDARTDIFSLGVVLYEMLAGQSPFGGKTIIDVIASVLKSEPPPLLKAAAHLPKELQAVVDKALTKNRDQRYHSAKDLLRDVRKIEDRLRLGSRIDHSEPPNGASAAGGTSVQRIPRVSQDALLLTEFENTTGEAIFDQTLKTALGFFLARSPFLNIVPDTKVSHTMRLMGRDPSERVTRALGEEICLRQNLKAFLAGTISRFGAVYVLALEAINARTGESLGREFEQVSSREEVLNALSRAATGIREKLGENLRSIERFNRIGDYTTSSLEALKMFSLGIEQHRKGRELEAAPFLRKAVEIDPGFASGYLALAVNYRNTNQWELASEPMLNAYELRDKVCEREKLRIAYFYTQFVTGDMDEGIDAAELWRRTYPLTSAPLIVLSDNYERIGQPEKAVACAREALRLDSDHAMIYMNLAESLMSLDQYTEVKETCRGAFEKNFDSFNLRLLLYQTAFIENNETEMAKNLKWFGGRKEEYFALDLQTGTSAFHGKRRAAQGFARRAVDLAERFGAKEVAAKFAAELALRMVFWSSGTGLPTSDDDRLKAALKTQLNHALDMKLGKEVVSRAALALAAAGQTTETCLLVEELHAMRPKDTLLNELWLPTIRAAQALQSGDAGKTIGELEITERFEKAGEFYPQYLRGLAYLKLNRMKEAASEFDKILNHRGEAPLSSIYALAQRGKARALKDKSHYEKFFEIWKDADKDMPALVTARSEFEALA
jgi:serine/threonine protein kinase/Flp pilus assembly protein TadD